MTSSKYQPLSKGTPAPDLVLEGPKRSRVSTRGDENQASLLAFYKHTCPTCQFTFPFLERIHERIAGRPSVRVLGVGQDPRHQIDSFAAEHGITFPLLGDTPDYAASRAYGVGIVPTLFLISPARRIEFVSTGFSQADLKRISTDLALWAGDKPEPLFLPEENVPKLRPG